IRKAGDPPTEGRKAWSVRWTASLVALTVLMFVVGISATAVVHQAGWLIASRRSLVEERQRYELDWQHDWGTSAAHLRRIGSELAMLKWALERSPAGDRPDGKVRQSWMTDVLPGIGFNIGGE